MKTQLIITRDQMVLVSDEEIKGRGYRIDLERGSIGLIDDNHYYNKFPNRFKKVIAGIPELPKIDLSDLSEYDHNNITLAEYDLCLLTINIKVFDVEVEIFRNSETGNNVLEWDEIKITNNSIKVIKIV